LLSRGKLTLRETTCHVLQLVFW